MKKLVLVFLTAAMFLSLSAFSIQDTQSSSHSNFSNENDYCIAPLSLKVTGVATGTMGQKNALSTAKDYLKYSAFSYSGLIDQLEYEGYSYSEAVYAVDNCGADWYEQAKKCARDYLKSSAFSYSGLVDQLEYEGFTHSEAVYGVDNCNADWNEQAKKCAASYLKYSSFSRSGLIDQLEYEGFTYSQAVYGVDANGYGSTSAPKSNYKSSSADDSIETAVALIQSIMEDSFDYCEVEADDDIIFVYLGIDGVAEELAANKALGKKWVEEWEDAKEAIVENNEKMLELVQTICGDDVAVSIMVVNDLNPENVLLATFNGMVFYDLLTDD